MRVSRYNWIVENKGNYYVFNGMTGAIASFESEYLLEIEDLFSLTKIAEVNFNNISNALQSTLLKGGYVYKQNYDERDLLSVTSELIRYNKSIDSITAIMTTDCNFRCPYCYESSSTISVKYMSNNVIDAITSKLSIRNSSSFSVVISGGEPLLALDSCVYLLEKCNIVANNSKSAFKAALVTNGYLLTDSIACLLANYGVSRVQVTLDGPKDIHNVRRPLSDGSGTYDVIVDNIKSASKYFHISVRCNIDPAYEFSIEDIDSLFCDYTNVIVYGSPVLYDHVCDYNRSINSEINYWNVIPSSISLRTFRLKPKLSMCGATTYGNFVVCPDGRLLKCWEEVNTLNEYGSIFDDEIDIRKSLKWLSYNPYSKESECWECKYLPLCGGGCPAHIINGRKRQCLIPSEDIFIQRLKLYIDNAIDSKKV